MGRGGLADEDVMPGRAGCLLLAAAWLGAASPAFAQAPSGDPLVRIDSVAAEGMERLSRGDVVGTAGIQPGSLNSWLDIQRAVKALWATGHYDDVVVRLDESTGRNVLVFEVEERPLARLIRITGLESLGTDDVLEAGGLEEDKPLSPNGIEKAKAFIRDELRQRGVPFARIEQREQPVPGSEGRVDVVLEVEEGQRVTIAQVSFSGNERFSDAELRDAMTTKPEGFLWFRGGNYDELEFEADLLEALPKRYYEAGFLDFEVQGDSLIVDPRTGKARVEIRVSEGPQYTLAEFAVEGANAFEGDDLKRYFDRGSGGLLGMLGIGGDDADDAEQPVFDAVAFEEGAGQVQELYTNQGYLYARISPSWERIGDGEDGRPQVRATWWIEEQSRAFVNRIVIAGNDFTYDRVIREKVLLLPGDVYSQAGLLQSYQNIQSLGFFETPMPPPEVQPQESGDVDIVFTVKEKQTGSIQFGTAVGGAGVGLSGFLGYDQPNLFGQAKSGSIRWDFGRYIRSFTLSASDPALFQSTVSGSISLFNSTDRFYQFTTGRRRRAGFTTTFGIPFPGSLWTRVFFGYSLSRTSYELFQDVDDSSLFGLPPGTLSSFSFGVTRRTLNHPLFPTSGSLQSWTTELNGGPLGGAGDFVKNTAEAQWLVPIGGLGSDGMSAGGVQFALAAGVRGGALFGDASRFPFESFWLGGVQFGQPLRGYEETTITPVGYFGRNARGIAQIDRLGNGYFSATGELRAVISSNVGLAAFFDAGNLWDHPRDFSSAKLYRGAGFGVQLMTPFGPIGLDYAYGFDKAVPGWQLHFKMGPNF